MGDPLDVREHFLISIISLFITQRWVVFQSGESTHRLSRTAGRLRRFERSGVRRSDVTISTPRDAAATVGRKGTRKRRGDQSDAGRMNHQVYWDQTLSACGKHCVTALRLHVFQAVRVHLHLDSMFFFCRRQECGNVLEITWR